LIVAGSDCAEATDVASAITDEAISTERILKVIILTIAVVKSID